MNSPFQILAELACEVQQPHSLNELLQLIVDRAATLLDCPRVSIRLLDPSATQLLAVCRAGLPLHRNPVVAFRVGEGLMGWIVAEQASIRSGNADDDPRFAPRPGMTERMGSFLGVPLIKDSNSLGVISAVNPTADYFTREHEETLILLASICAPHVEIARLTRLATVDPLTGALNRRGLDEAFPEIEQQEGDLGASRPLSVAMADVDHFKRTNDEHGHSMGDRVLKQVGQILADVIRQGDAVVRYGGEEFLLLLAGSTLDKALLVAERARAAIEGARFTLGESTISITISIGVAQRSEGEARNSLIERADAALYEAKRGGRNRVALAD